MKHSTFLATVLALSALTFAPAVHASGSSAPAPCDACNQPDPAPAPQPPLPVPPPSVAGTRFAALQDLYARPNTLLWVDDFQTWSEYKTNPKARCIQIERESPDVFDFDVVVLRMRPIIHDAGPIFPGENASKITAVNYSALSNGDYTDERLTNELWDDTVQSTEGSVLKSTYAGRAVYTFKQIGNLGVWHVTVSDQPSYEAYGYCFPKSAQILST